MSLLIDDACEIPQISVLNILFNYNAFGYGNGTATPDTVAGSLNLNSWSHVTVAINGINYIKLYVNGSLVGTQTTNTAISHWTSFWIGRCYNAVGRYFQRHISQMSIYNRELSNSEISQNCNAIKSRFVGIACN